MDPSAFETLITALKDKNPLIRDHATGFFIEIGEPAVKPLAELLKDENKDVRGQAVCALGEIGGTRATKLLVGILKDEDDWVRWEAVDALIKVGKPAVELLV